MMMPSFLWCEKKNSQKQGLTRMSHFYTPRYKTMGQGGKYSRYASYQAFCTQLLVIEIRNEYCSFIHDMMYRDIKNGITMPAMNNELKWKSRCTSPKEKASYASDNTWIENIAEYTYMILRTKYFLIASCFTLNSQGRIVTWDLPGNKIAAHSAKIFFVPGSAWNVPR